MLLEIPLLFILVLTAAGAILVKDLISSVFILGTYSFTLALVWALRNFTSSPRPAAALAGLTGIGMALNLTGLLRGELDVRVSLRIVACVVAASAAIGALLLWYRMMYEVLPTLPKDDAALRARVSLAGANMLWVAMGLVYVAVSIGILPRRRRARAAMRSE